MGRTTRYSCRNVTNSHSSSSAAIAAGATAGTLLTRTGTQESASHSTQISDGDMDTYKEHEQQEEQEEEQPDVSSATTRSGRAIKSRAQRELEQEQAKNAVRVNNNPRLVPEWWANNKAQAVDKYLEKATAELGLDTRPDLARWRVKVNASLAFADPARGAAVRSKCAVCDGLRPSSDSFCWNEFCPTSPIYCQLPRARAPTPTPPSPEASASASASASADTRVGDSSASSDRVTSALTGALPFPRRTPSLWQDSPFSPFDTYSRGSAIASSSNSSSSNSSSSSTTSSNNNSSSNSSAASSGRTSPSGWYASSDDRDVRERGRSTSADSSSSSGELSIMDMDTYAKAGDADSDSNEEGSSVTGHGHCPPSKRRRTVTATTATAATATAGKGPAAAIDVLIVDSPGVAAAARRDRRRGSTRA